MKNQKYERGRRLKVKFLFGFVETAHDTLHLYEYIWSLVQ
jgi:hypothetical protein